VQKRDGDDVAREKVTYPARVDNPHLGIKSLGRQTERSLHTNKNNHINRKGRRNARRIQTPHHHIVVKEKKYIEREFPRLKMTKEKVYFSN